MSWTDIFIRCACVLATGAAIRLWRDLDNERRWRRELQSDLAKLREKFHEVNSELYRHESNEAFRDLIRQRDRYQRQAIDLQLATNGLLSEREELFRELRRRAN